MSVMFAEIGTCRRDWVREEAPCAPGSPQSQEDPGPLAFPYLLE